MKLLALLFLLLLPTMLQAQFTYTTNNDAVTITGYTGSNSSVIIPSVISNLPVTRVGDWAFYATSVANILIPDSITSIEDGAFFDCQSLTNVTLGSSVTNIGNWVFGFCNNLISINCRGNAPSLDGSNVFYGNLATIYYLSGSIGWGLTFDSHQTVLWNPLVPFNYTSSDNTIRITKFTGSDKTVIIPDVIDFLPVTSIGDWTFGHNQTLTNVYIPESIISIGNNAFADTRITTIVIPNSVSSLGNQAFGWCSLTSIIIPDSVTNMGYMVFYGDSLTNAEIGNGINSIAESSFESCSSLVRVIIGTNVTSIKQGAFSGCINLKNILIPDGVTSIGDFAFINCYALNSVIIPDNVIDLGIWVFAYCSSMTNAVIGSHVTSIRGGTFSGTALTVLTVPDSVTNIEGQAFQYCGLITAYCKGNAPFVSPTAFDGVNSVIFYYLLGTTGWSSPFNGFAAMLWKPQIQNNNASFGVHTNQFGFNINWASGQTVVVEASTNLSNPDWQPVQTNMLTTGSVYFSDPQWTNYPGRFYRLRSP